MHPRHAALMGGTRWSPGLVGGHSRWSELPSEVSKIEREIDVASTRIYKMNYMHVCCEVVL
jgi:hypothetical protein